METLPRAEVTVYSPLVTPFRKPLETEIVSIGRASDCTIPIKDRYLSRKHAELVVADGKWVLKDLGSANGTYLNGDRVQQDLQLKTGDRIRLGDTELVFEAAEHHTDRFVSISNSVTQPTIAIAIKDLDAIQVEAQDVSRLHTLNALARELLEDHPLDQLFDFMIERIMEHLQPSRAALALLSADGRSFDRVELRKADREDLTELTISHTLLDTVVREKKALACIDVSGDEKLSVAKSIVMQGIRSIACAPLMIDDDVVGVLYVDYLFTQRSISEEDVRLVAHVARFAATKLETTRLREQAMQKRLIDEELKTAAMIQQRLLPPAPTDIPGFTFVGSNQPCRTVSGDYYDFIQRPDGRLYFVIADVSGKGVTAGLMMAGLQVAFRIFSKADPEPALLGAQLNAALREILPRSKFVTLFAGRLDLNTGIIEFVNCGHTPPLLVRHEKVDELGETDILLGVVADARFHTQHVQLEPGDSLVLFTDGVTEAADETGLELGGKAVAERLQGQHGESAEVLARTVTDAVLAHVEDPASLGDDVTIVIVSRNAVEAQ